MNTATAQGQTVMQDFAEVERRYREQVVKHYSRLSLTGLPERDPGLHDVPLERIFVKLSTKAVIRAANLDPETELERRGIIQETALLQQQGYPPNHSRLRELRLQIIRLSEAHNWQTVDTPLAEGLSRYRYLAITGAPGSGKTTLTRWLALTFAQNVQRSPTGLGLPLPSLGCLSWSNYAASPSG